MLRFGGALRTIEGLFVVIWILALLGLFVLCGWSKGVIEKTEVKLSDNTYLLEDKQ